MTRKRCEILPHVVIVEDEQILQDFVRLALENAGYRVSCATTAREAHGLLSTIKADLVILDLALPDEDGLVVARQIRSRSDMPIVIFTANEDSAVRLAGYEIGVDDFILKDTNVDEFMLRIRNVLRRGTMNSSSASSNGVTQSVQIKRWLIQLDAHTVTEQNGSRINLTAMEFRVLAALVRAPNRILSRAQLLDAITDAADPPSDRTIDAFISRIRRKLGSDFPLTTVKGLGYRLEIHKDSV